MQHLLIAIISYFSFLFLEDLSSSVRISLFILSIIATFVFFFSKGEAKQKYYDLLIEESNEKKKNELPYFEGEFSYSSGNFLPYLPEHLSITIETKEGMKQCYCDNEFMVQRMENHKGKIRFYYNEMLILYIDLI